MDGIGSLLLQTRESSGITLQEVSEDLNIEEAILQNIEDGKTGAFSDIFTLKSYVYEYAKYLGLDCDKIIDEFNEYVFESTSRIPIKEIEKRMQENKKNEDNEEKVVSPYTKPTSKNKSTLFVLLYLLIFIAVLVAVIWSIMQITTGTQSAMVIGYK